MKLIKLYQNKRTEIMIRMRSMVCSQTGYQILTTRILYLYFERKRTHITLLILGLQIQIYN